MLYLTKGVTSVVTIGSNIRDFRLKKKLTQEQLAEKLGVTFQAVSKWETRANTPDIQLLPEIAKALGIRIDDLFSDPGAALPSLTERIKDDDIIRIVQMKGTRVLDVSPMSRENPPIQIQFPRNCNEKTQYFKVEIYGHVISEGAINGDVISHGSIDCSQINAAGDVVCDGDIRAHEITSFGHISCQTLEDCHTLKCHSIVCSGEMQVTNMYCGENNEPTDVSSS